MKRLTMIAAMLVLAGCTDREGARKALEGAGYSEIETGSYALLSCGGEDQYRTKFTAKGPTGKHVEGAVCGGVFKGSTIRTE